jgi:hypothetical protein
MQLQDARVRNNILSVDPVCYILLWPFKLRCLTQRTCEAAFEVFLSIAITALPSRAGGCGRGGSDVVLGSCSFHEMSESGRLGGAIYSSCEALCDCNYYDSFYVQIYF